MNELEQIKEIIVKIANPDKIILFGSRTRGDHGEGSDYDILIIKNDTLKDRRTVGLIYKEFYRQEIVVSVDLLYINLEKYNELSDISGYVYKSIKKEGKTIYEK